MQGLCQQADGGREKAVPVLPQLPQGTGGSDADRHRSPTNRSRLRACREADPDFIAARHQAPVLPVERLEADYTVSDDVVPNHPHRQKACVSCLLTRTQENDVGTAGGDAIQLPGVQCPPVQDRPMLWAISCLNVWIFTVC